jgi:membrane-associated phospholipid phosphatase
MGAGDKVILAAVLFLVAAGWALRLPAAQQRQVVGLGLLGVGLIVLRQTWLRHSSAAHEALQDWLPCLQMLIVYWQAGRFYGRHSDRVQAWLMGFDRKRLGRLLDRWSYKWNSSWMGSYFELAYLMCYVEIPAGVGVLYWAHQRSAIGQYWAAVLTASCLCYVCVPFAQTLPPRLVGNDAPRGKQSLRSFNLYILRHASIHLNTFPSAHVASTIAASLVVLWHVPAAGVVLMLIALSIAAAAVLGRYHYALDVIFGAALAVFSAVCMGRLPQP